MIKYTSLRYIENFVAKLNNFKNFRDLLASQIRRYFNEIAKKTENMTFQNVVSILYRKSFVYESTTLKHDYTEVKNLLYQSPLVAAIY